MKKIIISLAIAFVSFAQVSLAQTRDEFIEKLDAVNIDDKKGQLAVLDAALKVHTKDADFYLRRADLKTTMEEAFSKKDTYGFIADYTKAIECENVSWRYESRANGYMLLQDYKKALEDATTALKMAEKAGEKIYIASASHIRAQVCMGLQDWKGAIENYEKSVKNREADSFTASILNDMSGCAVNLKDYDNALKYIDRAIEIYKKLGDNTEGTMYYSRGLIKIENMNKKAEGCADLKNALKFGKAAGIKDMIEDAIKKHCK